MLNEKYRDMYLIKPAEDGTRQDTKLAVEYGEEEIAEFIKSGYVIVNQADFNKLIGNTGGEYLIADDGRVYPKPAPTDAELLAVAKPAKIAELKAERDSKEVEPITYNGNRYDYDDKARERINAAIIALELQGEGATIDWTTTANADTPVTATDLKMIIAAVAVRSNALHNAYRVAKEKVLNATTKEEVEKVVLNE